MGNLLDIVYQNITKFNNESTKYRLVEVNDDDLRMKHMNIGADYRLGLDTFKGSAISLAFLGKDDKEIKAVTTLFIYHQNDYQRILFWYHQKAEDHLYKISVQELSKFVGDGTLISLGFTKSTNDSGIKYVGTKFMLNLTKNIQSECNAKVFIEATGSIVLNNEVLINYKLPVSTSNIFDPSKLGIVREESKAVPKFAKLLGLKKVPDLYSYLTLGPVYFLGGDGINDKL